MTGERLRGLAATLLGRLTWAGVGAALGVLVVLVGECRAWRSGTGAMHQSAVIAEPTEREVRSAVVYLPCEPVQALDPTPKDRGRIASDYARPDLAAPPKGEVVPGSIARILGERELPRLPDGGTALVTLEPGGRVEVAVRPEPERLLELRSRYEVGGLYGVGTGGETRARGWAAVEPLRWGRLHVRSEVGADLRAGVTDGYAMVGVVWRSR